MWDGLYDRLTYYVRHFVCYRTKEYIWKEHTICRRIPFSEPLLVSQGEGVVLVEYSPIMGRSLLERQRHSLTTFERQTGSFAVIRQAIQDGDMVVVKEDNIASCEWLLGSVQRRFPGSDGRTRVVDVLTTRGTIKRPIAKLTLFPSNLNVQPVFYKCYYNSTSKFN